MYKRQGRGQVAESGRHDGFQTLDGDEAVVFVEPDPVFNLTGCDGKEVFYHTAHGVACCLEFPFGVRTYHAVGRYFPTVFGGFLKLYEGVAGIGSPDAVYREDVYKRQPFA